MDSLFYRSSNRAKKKSRPSWLGLTLALAGGIAFYCVLFPSGLWGARIEHALLVAFGIGRYVVPLAAVYVGLRLALSRPWPLAALESVLGASLFFFGLTFASLFSTLAFHEDLGGVVGNAGAVFLARLFGTPGAWLVSLAGAGLSLSGLFRVSPVQLFELAAGRLKSDLEEWRRARVQQRIKQPPVVKSKPAAADAAPAENRALAGAAAPVINAPPKVAAKPAVQLPLIDADAKLPRPEKTAAARAPAADPSAPAVPPAPPPYQLPPATLLSAATANAGQLSEAALVENARLLEGTLANFGVQARTTDIHPGPVITRYDLEPAPGVKISSIVNLADDIALAMKATRVRVLAPVPGKGAVGIEIPNPESTAVSLREIISDAKFQNAKSPLTVALGKTANGEPYVTDLAPMPHLLVAGATGAGKSVCIHTLIMSVLMRAKPDLVKFCLIDPKRLELPIYDGMPHLYDPRTGPEGAQVITHPKEAAKALQRLVKVMEHRYDLFAKANVRNIEIYNEKRLAQGLPPEFYIIVIIDELADLMLISAREVEDCIQRLAQMARAVGIHLVLATQRPSVDVITGVIKANLPARIALRVASQTDSRVILDTVGAESLVGRGDMLFLPAGAPAPIRLQGAFVSERDVEAVVKFGRDQCGPSYEDIFAVIEAQQAEQEDAETRQELDEGLRLIMERKRVSQDLLKAHFGSSARATNVLSLLEVRGFIHKPEGTNRWEIYFDRIEDFFRARHVNRTAPPAADRAP